METEYRKGTGDRQATGTTLVDPRAPRFGQALTASGLVVAIALQVPALVFAVTVALVVAVASGWRLDPYALLWRTLIRPVGGPPPDHEPAAPHRFARVLGAVVTTLASVAILAGAPLVGYLLAGSVALLAGLAATTGFCLGCRLYGQVAFFRRLGVL